MASPCVGFSDLPTEALDEIARRVGPLDNVLCSAVCRSWRRALRTTRLHLLRRWPNRPHNIQICPRSNVVKVSPYRINVGTGRSRHPIPVETVIDEEVAHTRIIGCSYGWAITVNDDTWDMFLLDPFTGRSFRLPPFIDSLPAKQRHREEPLEGKHSRFWRHKFRKAALAPGRRLGTYAMMLLHSNERGMSYVIPGATSWATLRLPKGMPYKYLDVIFHKGDFYMVSCYAELHVWVTDPGGGMRARRLTDPLPEEVWAVITESMSGDGILMVSRREHTGYGSQEYNSDYWSRRPYTVHRFAETERRWLYAEDLEKMTILVGVSEGCSFCGPRSDEYGYGDYYTKSSFLQVARSGLFTSMYIILIKLPYLCRVC
ncbi:unnamed protein product [Alopecurus aequalis]